MRSIRGINTSLIEISENDAEDILRLRNDSKYNKFLFQQPITLEDQISWIRKQKSSADSINFKVVNEENQFTGTISIYNINNGRGEFGRYIVTNPLHAIEAEYLLLKYSFDILRLERVFCQTNIKNIKVWKQHLKMGFRTIDEKEVLVGSLALVKVTAIVQEITQKEFSEFDFGEVFSLLNSFWNRSN